MSKTNLVTGGTRSLLTSEVTHLSTGVECRQKIPIKKQLVDPFRQGIIIEGNVIYRQTLVIRSYEVGADKTATLESILNLLQVTIHNRIYTFILILKLSQTVVLYLGNFLWACKQETALNHVWVSGLLGDGFGATRGMVRNNLIWVVSRMQVQVDEYPIWWVLFWLHLLRQWSSAESNINLARSNSLHIRKYKYLALTYFIRISLYINDIYFWSWIYNKLNNLWIFRLICQFEIAFSFFWKTCKI